MLYLNTKVLTRFQNRGPKTGPTGELKAGSRAGLRAEHRESAHRVEHRAELRRGHCTERQLRLKVEEKLELYRL